MLLLIFLMRSVFNPNPNTPFNQLKLEQGIWHLRHKNNRVFTYNKIRILLEMPLFFLLELRQGKHYKVLVIFFDQVSHDDYRQLKLIERLS